MTEAQPAVEHGEEGLYVPRLSRHLLERRESWLDTIRGDYDQFRSKEGASVRWAGRKPATMTTVDGSCVEGLPTAGKLVAMQGTCEAQPGSLQLPTNLNRAELGAPFSLQDADFPLLLTVSSLNASMRGTTAQAVADGNGRPRQWQANATHGHSSP